MCIPEGLHVAFEEAEVANLVDAYIARREADHLARRLGVEPVNRRDVLGRHHLVVGEGERGQRRPDRVEEARHARPFGADRVPPIEAPTAPLRDHAAGQIAHHAEARTGEIAEQRRRQRDGPEPEEPHASPQLGRVLAPVAAARGDGDDLPDPRSRATLFLEERDDLPAQAVAEPGQRQIARASGQRVHRGSGVERRPGLDGGVDLAQRPAPRETHPAEVERQDVKALRHEETRERLVETLGYAHRRHQQHGAPRDAVLFDTEEARGQPVSVPRGHEQIMALVVLGAPRPLLFPLCLADLLGAAGRRFAPGDAGRRGHGRRGGGSGSGHGGGLLRVEATSTASTLRYCCDRDR